LDDFAAVSRKIFRGKLWALWVLPDCHIWAPNSNTKEHTKSWCANLKRSKVTGSRL